MAKSLMQEEKQCYFCGKETELHKHHVFFGTANRVKSESYGCWCYLCAEHHTGNRGVHFDKVLDLNLKRLCQMKFEMVYNHRKFMEVFGRNWL